MTNGSDSGGGDRVVHELVAALDYPMFVVTAAAGGERAGCLVGFTTQCSIDPPRFLVCLSTKNRTFRVAREADLLIVHMVPSDATELAELFGGETGDEVDKFARCAWHPGPADTPVLEECGNWFAGRILERFAVGDHHAFLLEPLEAHSDDDERQFDFHRAQPIEPGHEA
jgi:flavin reductase (DIM6/NTAB) family NADH-FMN oxidoreductase RutF